MRCLVPLALTFVCALPVRAAEGLPFRNADFEAGSDETGKPNAWAAKVAEAGAIAVDTDIKHSGEASVRIRQTNPSSYSYVMQGIKNAWPQQRMTATVWVKCESIAVHGIGPRLYCGYEGGWCHAARGPVLDETGSCDWQQIVVPFNTRDKTRVEMYLYLHKSTGTIWFDDLRVTPTPFEVTLATFASAPVIDGSPGDAVWAEAAARGMVWADDGAPAAGRSVKLGHDARMLFALVQAPSAKATEVPREGPHVTVAIDPEAAGERGLFFHMSPDGQRWTSAVKDTAPAGKWEVAVHAEGDTLTAEFAIPLATLRPSMRTGHHWRLNVIDHRPEARDAELVFTGSNSLSPAVFADAQLPALDLTPHRQAELKARLTRIIDEYEALSDSLRLDVIPDEFEGKDVARKGMDSLGRDIEQVSRDALALEAADDEQWRAFDERLATLAGDLKGLRSDTRPVAAYALARKFARKPTWSVAIETSMTKVHQDAKLLTSRAADAVELSAARGEGESVQLVVMPLTQDVSEVRVTLPAALIGPGGARIPRSALELNTIAYVRCPKPAYKRPADTDWWPDVLLPYEPISVKQGEVRPFWLTVWVPREAPAGLYRGRIVLTAKGAHKMALDLKLRVYDFELPKRAACRTSFGLGPHWISAYYFGDKDAEKHIDGPTYQSWCNELLRHRISPYLATSFRPKKNEAGEYQFQPWEDNIAFCMERGLTSMMLTIMPGTPNSGPDYHDEFKREFAEDIGAACGRLKQRGWLPWAFVCAWDEPNPAAYPGVIAGHKLIRNTCPDIKILQTVNQDNEPSELVGDVDIWCPITARWNPDFYHQRQAAGEEVWWYVCCGPHPPHATFFIDEDAIDHRLLFWQTWQQKVQGVLFWQTTWWDGNCKPGGTKEQLNPAKWVQASHKVFKVNGDGHLLYPGRDLAPLSSLRLAVIRDGVEDYDYFRLLEEAARSPNAPAELAEQAKALLEMGPEVSRSATRFCKDPEVLQHRRNAVAEMIELLRKK